MTGTCTDVGSPIRSVLAGPLGAARLSTPRTPHLKSSHRFPDASTPDRLTSRDRSRAPEDRCGRSYRSCTHNSLHPRPPRTTTPLLSTKTTPLPLSSPSSSVLTPADKGSHPPSLDHRFVYPHPDIYIHYYTSTAWKQYRRENDEELDKI